MRVDVLCFGISVKDKFILVVLGIPQVGSLIYTSEYEKSGRTSLFSKFSYVYIFWILITNGEG